MSETRTVTISLWLVMICLVGFGMFVMKNQVQALEKELQRINGNIQDDIKTIHVLKAEWSHLNSPARLKQLVEKHISLNPVKAEQIINYSALPFENEDNRRMVAQKNLKVYVSVQR